MRQALKEPVAFFGGVFAGVLGLSTTDEPLKAWVLPRIYARIYSCIRSTRRGAAASLRYTYTWSRGLHGADVWGGVAMRDETGEDGVFFFFREACLNKRGTGWCGGGVHSG